MSLTQIAKLEHASRSTLAWIPEDEVRVDRGPLTAAALSGFGIIAVAAALLLAIL